MKNAIALLLLLAALAAGQDYALGPDSQPNPNVPKGTVTKHVLEPGKYFPGTPHNYSIYVPAQYKADRPAPFMIFLDGSGSLSNNVRVPVVFDNLIAKGDVPPMIGIFVDPGVLPTVSPDAQNRFERVFEYDSLSDRFSRFLIEELVPAVGKNYNLSKDPNDHGISGVSTGAVGAFAAAWNRPDQFRRVLSFIGTFVAMKGADGLPALIRKTEPKPIRIFLQAGKNDHIEPNQPFGTFYGGSWPVNNQVMLEAFQFAGYDAKLELGTEAHNMKHGAAIMPDALRWLWRGYPEPIRVKEPAAMTQPGWDPRGKVYSTVWADRGWEKASAGTGSPAVDSEGNVYVADPPSNRILKADGAVFKENTGGANAIAFGPGNKLYASQPGRKRIVVYDGVNEKVAAPGVTANSIVVTAKGAVYFTESAHRIATIDARGGVRTVYQGPEMAEPFGLALSPDHSMLIATDLLSRFAWSFQIAADGGLVNGEPFYRLEMPESGWRSEAKGAVEDAIGQVYFATAIGIQVCEANGRVAQILNPPVSGPVTGIAFGGKDRDWLYVTTGGQIFRRPVKVKGFGSPVKPPKPPL